MAKGSLYSAQFYMSNSGLSVINLPECLYELLNIPLQKSSRKTQQVELLTLASYHFTWRFSSYVNTVARLILEPAVERLNVHYRSFSKFINSLKWIENHKKVWRKRCITSSYL